MHILLMSRIDLSDITHLSGTGARNGLTHSNRLMMVIHVKENIDMWEQSLSVKVHYNMSSLDDVNEGRSFIL